MNFFSELCSVKFLYVGSKKVLDWTNKEERVILQFKPLRKILLLNYYTVSYGQVVKVKLPFASLFLVLATILFCG